MSATDTIHRYVPEGMEPPATVKDVLVAARQLLSDEQRWLKGSLFRNDHPEVDPSTPFCNDWKVCAQGAVHVVTYGVREYVPDRDCGACQRSIRWDVTEPKADDPQRVLHDGAMEALHHQLPPGYSTIPSLNDRKTTALGDVLGVFDAAIAALENN